MLYKTAFELFVEFEQCRMYETTMDVDEFFDLIEIRWTGLSPRVRRFFIEMAMHPQEF